MGKEGNIKEEKNKNENKTQRRIDALIVMRYNVAIYTL